MTSSDRPFEVYGAKYAELEARVKSLERNYRSGEGALYDRVAALEAFQREVEGGKYDDTVDLDEAGRQRALDRAQGRREP